MSAPKYHVCKDAEQFSMHWNSSGFDCRCATFTSRAKSTQVRSDTYEKGWNKNTSVWDTRVKMASADAGICVIHQKSWFTFRLLPSILQLQIQTNHIELRGLCCFYKACLTLSRTTLSTSSCWCHREAWRKYNILILDADLTFKLHLKVVKHGHVKLRHHCHFAIDKMIYICLIRVCLSGLYCPILSAIYIPLFYPSAFYSSGKSPSFCCSSISVLKSSSSSTSSLSSLLSLFFPVFD